MRTPWSFKQKIGAGLALPTLLVALIGGISVWALRSVVLTRNQIAFQHMGDLRSVEKLRLNAQQKASIYRGFLLTRSWLYIEDAKLVDREFKSILGSLQAHAQDPEESQLLQDIALAESRHEEVWGRAIASRKRRRSIESIAAYFDQTVMPAFDRLERSLRLYAQNKEADLLRAQTASEAASRRAMRLILIIGVLALLSVGTVASLLNRALSRFQFDSLQAVRAREDMMAVVSHDLRNFLTSIQMSSSVLFRKAKQDTQGKLPVQLLQNIQNSAHKMNVLIQDLLDLAKLQYGEFPIEKHADDAVSLVKELLSILAPQIEAKNIRLETRLPVAGVAIRWDRHRMSQVLANLLGNAVKFTPEGGQISLALEVEPKQIRFSIGDTGPGIPQDLLPRIFERYVQARESARQGTGLGLSIAQGIVRAHGGEIGARNQAQQGSEFHFTLPLSTDDDSPCAVLPGLTQASSIEPSALASRV